jgi:polyhydroxybutyrate depolymerase
MLLRSLRSVLAAAVAATSFAVMPASVGAQPTTACGDAGPAMATQTVTLSLDGFSRHYLMHVPAHERGEHLPLVFAFHGRTQTPELLERYSQLDALHAVLVYPAGVPGTGDKTSWSGMPTAAPGVDDIHFTRVIYERVQHDACIDTSRVYATGKSDGGSVTGELACKAADIFSRIASVAGAYYPIEGGCTPTRPVAILEFHGDADAVIPYEGNVKRNLPDVHVWLSDWAQRDGCASDDGPKAFNPDVTMHRWSACRDGVTVTGYRIHGGGHTWPGAKTESGPGETSQAIDTTPVIARFFDIAT